MSFSWPVDEAILPALPALSDPPTEEEQAAYDAAAAARESAKDVAVQVLWALSGRQFGLQTVTARPSSTRRYWQGVDLFGWYSIDGDNWLPYDWRNRSVHSPMAAPLPGPVYIDDDHPVTVKLAGITLDPADYAVEGNVLYRRGSQAWPRQDLGRPLDEAGTWSATYTRGIPVPPGVDRLTALLAASILKEQDKCRVPENVVAKSSRGVSYDFDPLRFMAAGKTGIREIDRWLMAVNPNHLACAPEVL